LKKYINQTLEKEGKNPLQDFYLVDVYSPNSGNNLAKLDLE